MVHIFWIAANTFLILLTVIIIWFIRPHTTFFVSLGQFFAQIAILLFLVNINMYFIFLVIRKSNIRGVRIALAKFSRRMMRAHIPLAISGTALILFHAGIMLWQLSPVFGFFHLKWLTGYTALFMLGMTLFAGTLRHYRASGFRRRFHLISALIFGAAFLLHLFTPL